MEWLSNLGSGIGNFLGGAVNPVLGENKTEVVTRTDKPSQSSNTKIIIGVIAIVVIVGTVAYFYFKNKRSS